VLRASAARATPPSLFLARSFSNLFPQVHRIPGSLVLQGRHPRFLYQPCSHRMLSLGSIFPWTRQATPTPLVVARISRLEGEANVHPHDIAKQLELFEALMETNLESSYGVVISRWENMCKFVRSSRLSNHLHKISTFNRTLPHHC
jgi:ATP-dependent metalloprotease